MQSEIRIPMPTFSQVSAFLFKVTRASYPGGKTTGIQDTIPLFFFSLFGGFWLTLGEEGDVYVCVCIRTYVY